MAITDGINCACSDTTGNRTLSELRTDLCLRLGYNVAQIATVATLLDSFLQQAQRLAFSRLHDANVRTLRWFSWPLTADEALYDFPDNAEARTLPTPAAPTLATNGAGGTLAAATYSYRVVALNANGRTVASTAATIATSGATSKNTITFPSLTVPDGADAVTGWAIYGRVASSEQLLATVGLVASWEDTGALTPAGSPPDENTTAICGKTLDPGAVTWVGYEINGTWTPLRAGIPNGVRGSEVTGAPQCFEFRQCIEIWPPPAATEGNLVVKGHFGLEAFADDGDPTTIDSEAVFLLALANAKLHYRHPDANGYVQQYELRIRELVARSHTPGKRHIPGRRESSAYVEPRPLVPFA